MEKRVDWIRKAHEEAAQKVRDLLARPMPEDGMFGADGSFDPWDTFPALYGSYSSEFDDCAIQVLCDLRDRTYIRTDLAGEMLREMLCVAELCEYGTSPRVCFPTKEFKALLPALIDKWRKYYKLHWGEQPG